MGNYSLRLGIGHSHRYVDARCTVIYLILRSLNYIVKWGEQTYPLALKPLELTGGYNPLRSIELLLSQFQSFRVLVSHSHVVV